MRMMGTFPVVTRITIATLLAVLAVPDSSAKSCTSPEFKAYAANLIDTLPPGGPLREDLRLGRRGDGVKKPWMEEMTLLGMRQVSATVDFAWNNGRQELQIHDIR